MINKMLRLFIYILCVFCVSSCKSKEGEANKKMIYPYFADKSRVEKFEQNIKEVIVGSKEKKVRRLLGNPDEINPTYDTDNWNKKVGFSYVYFKQKLKKEGSVKEKGEKLIRVHFNLHSEVSRIDITP